MSLSSAPHLLSSLLNFISGRLLASFLISTTPHLIYTISQSQNKPTFNPTFNPTSIPIVTRPLQGNQHATALNSERYCTASLTIPPAPPFYLNPTVLASHLACIKKVIGSTKLSGKPTWIWLANAPTKSNPIYIKKFPRLPHVQSQLPIISKNDIYAMV